MRERGTSNISREVSARIFMTLVTLYELAFSLLFYYIYFIKDIYLSSVISVICWIPGEVQPLV